MKRKGEGCIINIASVHGIRGGRGATIYAASKAGVIGLASPPSSNLYIHRMPIPTTTATGFSRALAVELAVSRIRVNAISPGYIATDMLQPMMTTAEARRGLEGKALVGRLGLPEEVAHMALALATNRFVNATNLVVDGGLSAV